MPPNLPKPMVTAGRSCRAFVRVAWRAGLDFVVPPACPLCGREDVDAHDAPPSGFCRTCRELLAPEMRNSCVRCAAPVGPFVDTSQGCPHCRRDRFVFDGVVRLGTYDDLLRHLCLACKRPDGGILAARAAELLWETRGETLRNWSIDRVASVPMHWLHRMVRRHNAAETLAETLARRLRIRRSVHILAKIRRTPAQVGLPASRRRTNLRGVFRVRRPSDVQGRTVLLVDDVLTTGTTANEAAKALRRAGAERVAVAVLARGLGHV